MTPFGNPQLECMELKSLHSVKLQSDHVFWGYCYPLRGLFVFK